MNEIKINSKMTIGDIVKIARHESKAVLDASAFERIDRSRSCVEDMLKIGKPVYGVNTGFGKFSDVTIDSDATQQLQLNLILSHACGVGEPLPREVVRAMLVLRANALSVGYSGVRREVIEHIINVLNNDIVPHVPSQGSLGASGDLVPLAHMALTLLGRGKAYYKGELIESADALKRAGLSPVVLTAKEGLALINGTQAMTAIASLAVCDSENIMRAANAVLALTMEALNGVIDAYDLRLHKLRLQNGQVKVAEDVQELLKGSGNITKQNELRVQDAYTLRCAPQVHGATYDAINYIKDIISREINAVTDNPIIFSDAGEGISGGNFHGQYPAMAMDFLSIAISELANISERRIERLVNPQLSNGLPAFLVSDGGINSGFMIPQYVAAAIVSENKVLCHPAVVDSITSSANQEDHVSMGMTAARKARTVVSNVKKVLAIELLCAAQAIDLRKSAGKLSPKNRALYEKTRKEIPFVETDCILEPYINKAYDIIETI